MKKNGLKIQKVSIEKFRRFKDTEFELGEKVTLIAGQNGTSKSTLLGMIAQPFSFGYFSGKKAHTEDISKYTKNYNGVILSEYKDFMGNPFSYDCEQVFRLSGLHDTNPEKYSYKIFLEGNCIDRQQTKIADEGLLIRGHNRPGNTKVRFVAGPGKSSESGEGNYPHPVIYLGLNRLWPLALALKMNIENEFSMDQEAKDWFIEKYNEILLLDEPKNKTEVVRVDGNKKGFIGVSGEDYHSESFSAGQDNLGQILTSILSFRSLKLSLKEKYQGGVILIDEIDSTLHPKAQTNLLNVLIAACEDYDLQIVGTTHSLHLLKNAMHSKHANSIKINYLIREEDKVLEAGYQTFEEIEHNLEIKATPCKANKKDTKVSVVLEDKVANDFFFSLIGRKLDKYLKRFNSPNSITKSMSSSYIVNILPLIGKIPELSNIILIPDGDKAEEVKKVSKGSTNIVCLPGNEALEKTIFNFLKGLSSSHSFWKKCEGIGYNRQTAILDAGTPPKNTKEEKKWLKNWYKKQSPFWGRGNKIVFDAWAAKETKMCLEFCNSFLKALKKSSSHKIPKDIEEKILSRFK